MIFSSILLVIYGFLPSNQKDFNLSSAFDKEEVVNLSEIASDVKLIKLEYTGESTLSYLKGVIVFKNNILVYDVKNNLCLFDIDGKFIRRIGKIGRGPGEYTNILGIDADISAEIIYVLDNSSPYLLSYNLEGTFKPTNIKCREKISFCYSNGLFLFHTPINLDILSKEYNADNFYQLSIINMNGDIISNLHKADNKSFHSNTFIENASFIKSSNGSVLYHIFGDNKVYRIKNDSLKLEYSFDLGKYKNSNILNSQGISNQDNQTLLSINEILSIDKYIFLNYRYKNKPGLLFFNGSKFRAVDSSKDGTITDDIDGTGKLFYQLFFQDKLLIEPITVNRIFKKDYEMSQSNRIKKFKQSLNEYDNPILRIVSLK